MISNNLIDSITFGNFCESLRGVKISPSNEKTLLTKYKEFGYNVNTLKLSASEYNNIPYNQNIKLQNVRIDNVMVEEYRLEKGSLQSIALAYRDRYLRTYTPYAYYDQDTITPIISENGDTWMSPTLSEKNTMSNAVSNARDNVLTFGLGIGYFPYTCLLKDEVKSVTVVEINPRIIDLFAKFIYPQFQIDKQMRVIRGDLYDYFNKEFLSQYDHVFVDIWRNESDGLLIYEQLMKKEVYHPNIDFWVEDNLFYRIQDTILLYFNGLYRDNLIDTINRTSVAGEFEADLSRHAMRLVHRYFRKIDETIYTSDDILFYLNDKNTLRAILKG
jgi:predicted methyltransferase